MAASEKKPAAAETKKPLSMWAVILTVIAGVYILSLIIPAGEFARNGRYAIPGTYHLVDKVYLSPFKVIMGMGAQVYKTFGKLFISIMVMGGLMGVVNSTHVIERSLKNLIKRLQEKAMLIVPFFIFAMGLFGCFGTMISSAVLFIPLGITLAKALHCDRIFGVALIIMGSFTGFMTSPINMLTTIMGQDIAGLQPYSGFALRTIVTVIDLSVVSAFIVWWGRRAQRNHDCEKDFSKEEIEVLEEEDEPIRFRDYIVLAIFLLSLLAFALGSPLFKFGVLDLASMMLPVALICGLVAGYDLDTCMKNFIAGSRGMMPVMIFMIFAAFIGLILNQAKILDSVVYYCSLPLGSLPKSVAAIGMFIVNAFINFFIPSGSGQTAVVMPVMAPLADVLGITRQMGVFTLQCGDGFTNLMIPTSSNLLPCLLMGGVTLKRWYHFILPCYSFVFVVICATILIGTAIGWA
ncbi:Na+/H+ antiporter NhaC family protein [Acidaminococcus timonensis]|uniref:Na+/H+ antiporter NhaC family protein n=1 Tax=Acidaminococcus timonensis TaxID=1871002 RepID=UPI00307A8AF3